MKSPGFISSAFYIRAPREFELFMSMFRYEMLPCDPALCRTIDAVALLHDDLIANLLRMRRDGDADSQSPPEASWSSAFPPESRLRAAL